MSHWQALPMIGLGSDKKRGKMIFTFYFLSTIIHKNSSQYWIVKDVKDGVSYKSYRKAGLDIAESCNIFPSLVSSIGKIWESDLYFAAQLPRGFHHFHGVGWGGAGRGAPPSPKGGAGNSPPPRRAGRLSLVHESLSSMLYVGWMGWMDGMVIISYR